MINERISNISFGLGTITSIENNYIHVVFDNKDYGEKIFNYPESFDKFLKFEDKALQTKVTAEIKVIHAKAEEDRKLKEAKKDQIIAAKVKAKEVHEEKVELAKKRKTAAKSKATKATKAAKAEKLAEAAEAAKLVNEAKSAEEAATVVESTESTKE